MMTKQTNRNAGVKMLVILLFLLYIAALFKILLFRDNTLSSSLGKSTHGVNLIPFKTITEYIVMAVQNGMPGLKQFCSNIIGNILILIPFGYFLPVLWKKFQKATRVIVAAAAFSVTIELIQYLWNVGSSDIDDILLNTLGGFFGFLIYRWISHCKPLKLRGYLIVICLSFVMFSGGLLVAVKDYSSLLGISTTQTQTVQQVHTIRYDQPEESNLDSDVPGVIYMDV